jgi:hypothetical protein
MNSSPFSLEFELNVIEIQKLNKMYFKHLFKERVTYATVIVLLIAIFFDFFTLNTDADLLQWELRNFIFVLLFLMFHYSFVNTICKIIFKLTKKLLKYTNSMGKYKLNFTNSYIYVNSPLGAFAHKWSQIEKAILTKDFFFLYVKDADQHIISISNKHTDGRNMSKLLTFVESNVTEITKI